MTSCTGCKHIHLGCVLVNHVFTVCICDALHSQFTENSFKKAENSEHNAVLLLLLFTLDNLQKCQKHFPQGGSCRDDRREWHRARTAFWLQPYGAEVGAGPGDVPQEQVGVANVQQLHHKLQLLKEVVPWLKDGLMLEDDANVIVRKG